VGIGFGSFFSTGLGLALHDGERDTDSPADKSLGSRVLFRIPIEIGYAHQPPPSDSLAFDHVSNAGLASPNEGMDTWDWGYWACSSMDTGFEPRFTVGSTRTCLQSTVE
jgi:hypothetical protein